MSGRSIPPSGSEQKQGESRATLRLTIAPEKLPRLAGGPPTQIDEAALIDDKASRLSRTKPFLGVLWDTGLTATDLDKDLFILIRYSA